MESKPAKIVVLGLGNVLHADDGAGVHVVRRLREDPRVPADIGLIEGGTLGLELLSYVWECSRLIVIDAVDVGRDPGTVVRMSGEELNSLPGEASVHQLGVSDLLVALRVLAQKQPEVVLLGVQPATTEWSTQLSQPVAAAMELLVDSAIKELSRTPEESAA
jgi:hydrogenase maturation protease